MKKPRWSSLAPDGKTRQCEQKTIFSQGTVFPEISSAGLFN